VLLDADKQLTFDTARLEFSRSSSMLVADIDELLYSNNIPKLRKTIDIYFNDPKYLGKENWWIPRYAVGGVSPTGIVEYTETSDKAVIDAIENCILNGKWLLREVALTWRGHDCLHRV
jgi:hypothetical protein